MIKQINRFLGLNRSIESSISDLSPLLEISHDVASLDIDSLLGLILDQLKGTIEYNSSVVMLLAENQLTPLVIRGNIPEELTAGWQLQLEGTRLHHEVVQRQKPFIIADICHKSSPANEFRAMVGEQYPALVSYGCSWLGVPLVIKEQLVGLLALFHCQPNYYTLYHARQILTFAQQIAIALEHHHLYQQVHHLAILQERARLAREMHDQLAQNLGYINLKTTAISELLASGQIAEAQSGVQELKQIARDTYLDVREEIFNLRTGLASDGQFLRILRDYLAEYEHQHPIEVRLNVPEVSLAEFSVTVGIQLIRIIQETLINVRKHTVATQVTITFKQEENSIFVSIEDNGQGFDPAQVENRGKGSFGLQIMKERAESVGAQLAVHSTRGEGTQVVIQVPVYKSN